MSFYHLCISFGISLAAGVLVLVVDQNFTSLNISTGSMLAFSVLLFLLSAALLRLTRSRSNKHETGILSELSSHNDDVDVDVKKSKIRHKENGKILSNIESKNKIKIKISDSDIEG